MGLLLAVFACSPSEPSRPMAESTAARAGRMDRLSPSSASSSLDLISLHRRGGLRALPLVHARTPHDAISKAPARFEGYGLEAVLRLLTPPTVHRSTKVGVRFHLADGRITRVAAKALLNGRGVLAVRDLGAPEGARWRPHQQGQFEMTPGPFYLVWDREPAHGGHPWISQIEGISLEDPSPADSPAFPRHAPDAERGFGLFRDQCLTCHSVNFSGGRLGPELNVPQSVTESLQRKALRTYIRTPREVRATATMPDFPHLTAGEVNHIVDYLQAMRLAKVCATQVDCARFRGE